MSDSISALLPSARVDIFALDDSTAATMAEIAADWRFARVGVNTIRGDIDAAIENYTQYASPELLIVETNDISDAFIEKLGQLAGACAEGTDAVIIGPMNDVHLYRSLIGMGVRDYLVRPVRVADLVSVIAKSLIDKRGMSGSRLSVVLGAKGGVGATTIAQMIASTAASALGQKTLLMDIAGSAGSLGVALGLEPVTGFVEAARIGASGSEDDLKRIIQSPSENLSVLVNGGEPILADPPEADSVETLVGRLMQKNPFVVIDLSSGPQALRKRLLSLASHVTLVTTPQLPPLRNARTLLNELKGLRGGLKDIQLVINMRGLGAGDEVPAADIKAALDFEAAGTLPYVAKLFSASEAHGKPVLENKLAKDMASLMLPIAASAAGIAGDGIKAKGGKKDEGGKSPFGFLKNIGKK